MRVFDAMVILGVREDANEAAIKRAANSLMFAIHPDVCAPDYTPKHTLAEVKEARDTLLRAADRRGNPCKMCLGRGWIPTKLGVSTCRQCGGSCVAV